MASGGTATPSAPPLTGDLRDTTAARRDSIRVQHYWSARAVKVLGDVDALSAEFRGVSSLSGRVSVDHLATHGEFEVAQAVVARSDATLRGSSTLGAGFSGGDLTVVGNFRSMGPVSLDGNAHVRGSLEVAGNLTARSLEFDGLLSVLGNVDAPIVKGRVRRLSRVGTLRSQHVRIVSGALPFRIPAPLIIDRIEATEVEIAWVDCEYLRADRIRLGPGAHVTRLDGEVVRQHRSAFVGPRSWEPLPAGITR
ncbi:MAG TPA: hypothetical protein VEY07_03500 [Thermoplasmata archaeon]|nr:hypothetical protein [Thermoplasmata archaeon]